MKEDSRIRFYRTFTEDFVESRDQDCQVPPDYVWVRKDLAGRILARLIYAAAWIFSLFYCRLWLKVRIRNRSVLKQCRDSGYFLYGNHTQPIGDAFIPAQVCADRHIYTVAGSANLGIPVLGKLLPLMGILPIPDNLSQMKEFWKAIETRIGEKKCVIVYPEAHVWPWYTGIRPFPETSFRFPVDLKAPSFCMTVTYQSPGHGAAGILDFPRKTRAGDGGKGACAPHAGKGKRKPRITVYIDGPFYPDAALSRKEQQKKLCREMHECMTERSKNSTYEYIRYERYEEKPAASDAPGLDVSESGVQSGKV
ncbi:MAG: hypothetical protein LUF35_01310 [Lachnospiraceae bacterium]|nr:hypothetical protein [Lachnospiraceae bacterium]